MGVGVGSPGRPGRDAAEDAGAAANFRRPALGDGTRTVDCRTVAAGAQWRCDPPLAIRPTGFESGPGWPSGGEPMEGPEWPGEWPAAPAGAWPPHDQGPREAGPGAVTRMAGWPQNGMSSSEKSSAGGGPDWRWGDWRCGADSWRGR